ncbi:MAG: 16S rRNA (guanine(527)-N(7))-methyltransferase RsmG [Gammaproteobacteria bacterium]|nr:16S rRNA (guanine(527)-N(7))-methyltransferase RsmG [Gammaproteobacteria bacterium]
MLAEQRLEQGLQMMGLELSSETQRALMDYLRLMQKWNRAYNLTAIRDLDQMVIRHLLDSLGVLPYINSGPVLDVGTGAGLPGIPLALAQPENKFFLLDSNGKKTRFLTQVKIELGIENIEVIHSRVEDFRPDVKFEIVICRAFAALNTILERTQHLVTSTTRILAMKGKDDLPPLVEGFEQQDSHQLNIAWLDEERRLLDIRAT